MRRLIFFLAGGLVFGGLLILQESRVVEVGGIVPNLLLVGVMSLFFLRNVPGWFSVSLLAVCSILVYVSVPSWGMAVLVLAVTASVLFLVGSKFLTGNALIDFPVSVFFLTFLFYIARSFVESLIFPGIGFGENLSSPGFLFAEAGYNVVMALVVGLTALRESR